MRLSDFNQDKTIDATPLLHMPSDVLRGLFSDVVPGSADAVSVARVLHSLAAFLTGERLSENGSRADLSQWGIDPDQASMRAVELIELADRLDGIGSAQGGAAQ